jgi:hypothetical protein
MLYREIIAVSSETNAKHTNALCGQNAEFVCVEPVGIFSSYWTLKGSKMVRYASGKQKIVGRFRLLQNVRGHS